MNHAYHRVSTDQQGLSVEAQDERTGAYCERKKMDAPIIYIDEDVSGSKPFSSRPGGSLLLSSIGPGDTIIAVCLDRTFRDIVDGLTMIRTWAKKGITLHIVDSGTVADVSDSNGFTAIGIQLLIAEAERMKAGERTKAALRSMKARGGRVTRLDRIPYGFMVDTDSPLHEKSKLHTGLKECPEEREVIEIMKCLRAEGLSLRAIGQELNNMNKPTRDGGSWHHDVINKILIRESEQVI